MRTAIATWRLFARRSGRNWRLLAVLALGMLMAASLLAAAPVYARTMADLGLTFTVRDRLGESPGNRVSFPWVPLGTLQGTALRETVEGRIDERIGWFAAGESRVLVGPRFVLAAPGEAPPPQAPLGQLQSITGYEAHVSVLEGTLPRPAGPGDAFEVAISRDAARAARLTVGQQIALVEDFDTCAREIPREDRPPPPPCTPTAGVTFTRAATITAIIEPLRSDDPFWVLPAERFFAPWRLLQENGPVVPMFVPEATLLEGLAAVLPAYGAATAWHTFARPETLSRVTFDRARDDLSALHSDLGPLGGASFSPLGNVLRDYGHVQAYQQTPLTILLLEIAAVAIFYVIIVSLVIVERQSAEVALLRSRGATVGQVGAITLAEGLLLGAPVLLLAPLVAAAGTALLGLTPTFAAVNGGALLPVSLPPVAFAYAGVGVAVSIVALLIPSLLAARTTAVARRREQARPGRPFFQRYYLDLALAGVAALLLWELNERGTVLLPSPTGGVTSDPLLLASPAILVAAAAALLLRVYPLTTRLLARLLGREAAPPLALGLWQVARSPGHSARLALLLAMAIAVGTFAASYATTASATFEERARFQAASGLRAISTGSADLGLDGAAADARLREHTDVPLASAVLRLDAGPAAAGTATRTFQALGLNPDDAPFLLWFRDDFAERPLRDLMAALGPPEPLRGIELPGGTTSLQINVHSSPTPNQMTLWARVRDATGFHHLVMFDTIEPGAWHTMSAPISRDFEGQRPEPLTLVGLVVTEPPNRFNTLELTILFDELAATTDAGTTVLDDFEAAVPRWGPLPARLQRPDTFDLTRDGVEAGQAGRITRSPGLSSERWGLFFAQPSVPLPVVATDSFLAATGLGVGAVGNVSVANVTVPIRVVGDVSSFPSLPAAAGPGIIFNRDQLISWLGLAGSAVVSGFNEAWLEPPPGADLAAIEQTLRNEPFNFGVITDRSRELERLERNPLISAGGAGILYLAFGAVLLLVTAALLVSLWLVVHRRRTEFAVLRSLGLSKGGVARVLAVEYSFVAIVGVVVGTWLGLGVASRMLSFLNFDEAGRLAEPSYILRTDWLLVSASLAAVGVAFLFALTFAVRLISRTSDAQALRME
jgi:hypothetical protein